MILLVLMHIKECLVISARFVFGVDGVYMRKFKKAMLTWPFLGLAMTQVQAGESLLPLKKDQPAVEFNQAEVNAMFDTADKPLKLAVLSNKEMKETEGAIFWNTVVWTVGGGAVGTASYLWVTPSSQWGWSGAGTAFGSGATAGFYNSVIPLRVMGTGGAFVAGTLGAGSWYR